MNGVAENSSITFYFSSEHALKHSGDDFSQSFQLGTAGKTAVRRGLLPMSYCARLIAQPIKYENLFIV